MSPSLCPGVSSHDNYLPRQYPIGPVCVCIEHGSLAKWHPCPLYLELTVWYWATLPKHSLYTFGGAICLSTVTRSKQSIMEHCNMCLLFYSVSRQWFCTLLVFTVPALRSWLSVVCTRNIYSILNSKVQFCVMCIEFSDKWLFYSSLQLLLMVALGQLSTLGE